MTPDEMKVLARVANRNAHDESPVVIDESRAVGPEGQIVDNSLTVEQKLDIVMEQLHEMQQIVDGQNQPTSANFGSADNVSAIADLAHEVISHKLQINNLSNMLNSGESDELVRKQVNLSSYDLISSVEKPYRVLNNTAEQFSNYTSILDWVNLKIDDTTATIANTKVLPLKSINAPRPYLKVDDFESSIITLNQLNGTIRKAEVDRITINAQNNINMSTIDFSKLPIMSSVTNVDKFMNVMNDHVLTTYSTISTNKINKNLYFQDDHNYSLTEDHYWIDVDNSVSPAKNILKYHDGNNLTDLSDAQVATTGNTEGLTSANSGKAHVFANGLLVFIAADGTAGLKVVRAPKAQKNNSLYRYADCILKATNTTSAWDYNMFQTIELMRAPSGTSIYFEDLTTKKLSSVNAAGAWSSTTAINTNLVPATNAQKAACTVVLVKTENGIQKLGYAASVSAASTPIFVPFNVNKDYIWHSKELKLYTNGANGKQLVSDGMYLSQDGVTYATSNAAIDVPNSGEYYLYNMSAGKIIYPAEFGTFNDDPVNVEFKDTQIYSCKLPTNEPVSTTSFNTRGINIKAITLGASAYYIDENNFLRHATDDTSAPTTHLKGDLVTDLNGLYQSDSDKFYDISPSGKVDPVRGYVQGTKNVSSNERHVLYLVNELYKASTVQDGSYVDSTDRVIKLISTNTPGEVDGISTFDNTLVKIITSGSFIIRKTVAISEDEVRLENFPNTFTATGSLISTGSLVYEVVDFKAPVRKLVSTVVFNENTGDHSVIDKNGAMTDLSNGHYTWVVDDKQLLFQVVTKKAIFYGSEDYNITTLFTGFNSSIVNLLFVLVEEKDSGEFKFSQLHWLDRVSGELELYSSNNRHYIDHTGQTAASSMFYYSNSGSDTALWAAYSEITAALAAENFHAFLLSGATGRFLTNRLIKNNTSSYISNDSGIADGLSGNVYVVKSGNSLEYWTGGNPNSLAAISVAITFLGFDDKLYKSTTATSGNAATIDSAIESDVFVIFTDNNKALFKQGALYVPSNGTIINVSSSDSSNSENGLKVYSEDRAGVVRWIAMTSSTFGETLMTATSAAAARTALKVPAIFVVIATTANADITATIGDMAIISGVQTAGVFNTATAGDVFMLKATGATTFANWVKLN